MSNNLDSKNILDNLNEKEKKVALSILEEIKTKGKSQTLQDLLLDDYKEIPVTIDEFIDNDNYLGYAWKDAEGKSKLYPYWRKRLKELFPDNIHTNVNNAIFSGARGIGKSETAVLIAAYLMHRIMCLKNPLDHFHLKPTEDICFAFMNIKLDLAEEVANSKFQNTIKLSPWFTNKGSFEGRNNRLWVPPSPIKIIVGSQTSDVIGLPIFFAFFDEISFIRNLDIDKQKEKAMDMIDTAIGGMKTRFLFKGKLESLLVLASSKRSEKSFLEEHMKKKLEIEKENVLIVDEAVWNVKPANTYSGKRFNVALGNKFLISQIIPFIDDINIWIDKGYKIIDVPVEFYADFAKDIERALCDFAGISSSELNKYISGVALNEIKNKELKNPFVRDIIEVGDDPKDNLQYYDLFDLSKISEEIKSKPLYIHIDMSINKDMTGIGGICIRGKKTSNNELEQSRDLFYSLVFSVSIKAPKGREISFEKNRNFIYWLKAQGFNIKRITTDSFQAYDTGQALRAKGYDCEILSVDRVEKVEGNNYICVPYQYFKNTIYEKRIEIYDSKELISEIIDLERNINTGKIDHPDKGKKDIADAVCGATYTASKDAAQYAYEYGENLDMITGLNKNTDSPQQLIIDFEEELRKSYVPLSLQRQMEENIKEDEEEYGGSYVDDGMIIW